MGAGLLSLPYAFTKSGLIPGIEVYILVTLLVSYTLYLLLSAKAKAQQSVPTPIRTYRDLGRVVLGKWGEWTILIQVIFLELAFCIGFNIVIVKNMTELLPHIFIHGTLVMLVAFPILTLLSWVRFLEQLWIVSFFGCMVYVVGVVGATWAFGIKEIIHSKSSLQWDYFVWPTVPLFVGTAVYSLEGINVVLPIQRSMKYPENATLVLNIGMAFLLFVIGSYGAFGYVVGYGKCDLITSCLPKGPLTNTIKAALCISLLATHPVTLYPASEILEEMIIKESITNTKRWKTIAKRLGIRTVLVALTCIVGGVVPNFSIFSDFVGSIMISFVGFIFPTYLYIKVSNDLSLISKILHWFIAVIGLFVLGVGTYSAIKEATKK
eukprot:TRINITY_DN2380_c0_g1_i14.p1 TRINITY_DN2380_c0_g1~~TRINITY_DN2380_c0_g1_i14.p1  ORF type:complete len:379 (+),score=31.90 TRINITY_DN2380_c0_g1_i14:211-1347(+)